MRIIMLSWEYPPRIVGGISRHVEELSWALAAAGHDVHVLTCAVPDAPLDETRLGVTVHRVVPYSPADNFVHWVQQLNAAMHDRATLLIDGWLAGVDGGRELPVEDSIVLHAHDWLAHYSGSRLKHQYHLPLVATIHATEHGRNRGIHTDQQRYIHSVECELVSEAWRVIVCSEFMKWEVEQALGAPWNKLDVIPNAINADKFLFNFPPDEAASFRATYAAPDEHLVLFSGRMVQEKGAHLLIDAVRMLRSSGIPAKLVVVGGGDRRHLEEQAERIGAAGFVYFTGFVPDDVLLRLYRVADAACYPSLYEPFGIVALEAMAAGVPVVVSDAGGLKEIVDHDRTGTVVWSGNRDSLVWGLKRVLTDRDQSAWMAGNARRDIAEVFNWRRVAESTVAVYKRVVGEYRLSNW